MRFAISVVGLLWLVVCACGAADTPLQVGVHVREAVSVYSPRYEGGVWESRFGARLKQEVESQLRAAFPSAVTLPSFSRKDAAAADAYVVVEQAIARFYGKGSVTAEAQASASVYDQAREQVKDIEVSAEYTLAYSKDTQEARCDEAAQEVARELAAKIVASVKEPELLARLARSVAEERARRERPAPAPAPVAQVFGRLVLTTTPPGTQVFLDDVYWGISNAEGKLTIAGVAAGAHVVRLKKEGFKELKQAVTVVAGDNPVALRAEEAGPRPLSEEEIEKALRYDVPKPRIKELVSQYGVTFTLTKDAEIRLLDAGADREMLALIANSRKQRE